MGWKMLEKLGRGKWKLIWRCIVEAFVLPAFLFHFTRANKIDSMASGGSSPSQELLFFGFSWGNNFSFECQYNYYTHWSNISSNIKVNLLSQNKFNSHDSDQEVSIDLGELACFNLFRDFPPKKRKTLRPTFRWLTMQSPDFSSNVKRCMTFIIFPKSSLNSTQAQQKKNKIQFFHDNLIMGTITQRGARAPK